jgi:hypothetical protein
VFSFCLKTFIKVFICCSHLFHKSILSPAAACPSTPLSNFGIHLSFHLLTDATLFLNNYILLLLLIYMDRVKGALSNPES